MTKAAHPLFGVGGIRYFRVKNSFLEFLFIFYLHTLIAVCYTKKLRCAMFSQILKRTRKQRNLKQVDVAKAIGTNQKQISKWETGKSEPDIRWLCLLADFFGVSIDYLVGRAAPQPKDVDARMKKLLDSLTPEQVSLLCLIAENALKK